ncbi:response regulator transcription factor [Orrella daihaiensis]|uniref:Response regulator transcription factor n=1 Tax=Orrella daihaiensis TaxID=2782176 RepID=A0ABY4AHY6_9BURK|nr:response regulator transcription factor [Orrella daihaiensis]UOD49896.1 response regulator transcription factor [Orrella daihaiensis]
MAANLNVLIVEDHDRLREILVRHLVQHGCQAVGVSDAEGLQDAMSRQSFDAVVLDLNLPDEDGLSIAQRLRTASPDLFIVMMTARNSTADRVAGYKSGADVYISKPSSGEELLAAIDSWRRRTDAKRLAEPRVYLNVQARELTGNGTVPLSAVETRVLQGLALAPGLKLEYFRLMELIDHDLDAKGKASLEVCMARLRKKLTQAGFPAPAIKSIRNDGYQLIDVLLMV